MLTQDQATVATDLPGLYASLSRRLEQIVRLDVRASDAVIEDACQFAWSRLVFHRDRVRRDAALSWLAKTAVHEAFKLIQHERHELSLDNLIDAIAEPPLTACAAGPQEQLESRERLGMIKLLPERQQRMLWLHAIGLSYTEMAAHERCTRRTVERQLLRAKHAIRHDPTG